MAMKLISIEFGEQAVELICADNADLEAAANVVTARLQMDPRNGHSLAWNRYFALQELQNLVTEQVNAHRQLAQDAQ
jgi:hypothetical protein